MFKKIWNSLFGKKCECNGCDCKSAEPIKVQEEPKKVEVISDVSSTPLTQVEEPVVKEKKVRKPSVKKTTEKTEVKTKSPKKPKGK